MRFLSSVRRRSIASRSSVIGGVLALAAGLVVAVAPTAAADDTLTDLGPVPSNRNDIVVAGDKVVVSLDDRIVFTDRKGEVEETITDVSGAHGLIATADGTRVYAALSGSGEVAEIDIATREIARRINLSDYGCPYDLALTGDRLWVAYSCGERGVLGLDLSTPESEPVNVDTSLLKAGPLIAAAGDTLVLGETLSPADLFVYDVSGAAPVLRGEIDGHAHDHHGLDDVAVTPDGSYTISAFTLPDAFSMWDAVTLTKVRDYQKGPEAEGYPRSVAISPDGAYIAGGRTLGFGMTVYDRASGAELFTANPPKGEVARGSSAYAGRDIYSLVQADERIYLWRLHDVTLPESSLTLTAEPGATVHVPFTMTGRLTFPDGTAPGAQPLIVTRTAGDGTTETLPGVTTAEDGTYTITDTPPAGGQTTYTVLWDGDGKRRWSKASVTMMVRYQAVLTLNGPATAVAGTTLLLWGSLEAVGTDRPENVWISMERTRKSDGQTVTGNIYQGGIGTFTFRDSPEPGEYTYTLRWPGDSRTGPAEASHTVIIEAPAG